MRRVLLLALLLLAVVGPARAGFAPGTPAVPPPAQPRVGLPGYTAELPSGLDGRRFVLHVPDGLLAPAPLLLVLHAYAKDAAAVRSDSRLEDVADRDGFLVAFPEGVHRSWDAGGCCGRSRDDAVDDVAYLDAVVATVRARALVDPSRIAVSGFSNGAMMALRYACERADVVSAVAVVAGTVVAPCRPSRPVAVLDLHGAADRTVPVLGGTNAQLHADFPPVSASLQPFRDAGGEVRVVVVPREGHHWLTGASGAVWDWVRDHPRT
ncbi:MAG: hypothetical protein JWN17_3267 [Frankiales bacterium]|nr:hypothetical protein [Frankiales bacterium]